MHYVDEVSWVSIFGPRVNVLLPTENRVVAALGADIQIRGWALCDDDSVAHAGKELSVIRIESGAPQPVWYGAPRSDIAAKFGRPELVECGFEGSVRVPDRCGSYDVSLRIVRRDNVPCDLSLFTLEVVPGTPQFPERLRDGEITFSLNEIRGFPGDGLRGPRLPMGCLGVVTGFARAEKRRNTPAMVYGAVIDGVTRCAIGERSEDGAYEFVWRFLTAERGYGRNTFTLYALTPDRSSYGASEAYEFENLPVEDWMPSKSSQRMPGEIVRVRDTQPLHIGDTLFVRGWAVDLESPGGVNHASICIDGDSEIALECRQYRSDIAQRLQIPEAAYCGFVGTIPTAGLMAGTHRAEVSLTQDETLRTCETDAVLIFELEP